MKRLVTILASLALLVGVTACNGPDEASTAADVDALNKVYEVTPTLKDGREVTCLVYNGYQKGGLSCDWEGAK